VKTGLLEVRIKRFGTHHVGHNLCANGSRRVGCRLTRGDIIITYSLEPCA
jgi:hypothetical protein